MLWSRKPAPITGRGRHAGLDVTSSRARGATEGAGKTRPLLLDEAGEDLLFFLALDRRSPEIGKAGYCLCRKAPHVVCSNFLPVLAQGREWRVGRYALTAEDAFEIALNKLRAPVEAESEAAVLAFPAYLAPAQVVKAVVIATRAKFPLKGTVVGPLALVADRAAAVLNGTPVAPEVASPEWVVPLRPTTGGPGSVVVVDCDEYALSAVVVAVERDRVRLVGAGCWPRFAVKAWKDRVLDGVSDRCVRLCRRDPRDSADAEQAMFEQLDESFDRARMGQRVHFGIRTASWFQDVVLQPEEFDGFCAALARGSAELIGEFLTDLGLPAPPAQVWLTHDASRLSGLAAAIHQMTRVGTAIEILPPHAVAAAAAALVPRCQAAEFPRTHLDSVIPLLPIAHEIAAEKPRTGGRR